VTENPAVAGAVPTSTAPAPVLAEPHLAALVATVAAAVARELNLATDDEAEPHAATALELIAVELDRAEPYVDTAAVPARVVVAATIVACDLYRRPGFAFGAIGIGEQGGTITAGRDPLGSVRGLLAGAKRRWGLA
jgi:hypothetical protein